LFTGKSRNPQCVHNELGFEPLVKLVEKTEIIGIIIDRVGGF